MKPLDFAHAILERRLTDNFINVEYVEGHTFGNKSAVTLTEPLHARSAERLVEAVENMALTIANTSRKRRGKIKCTRIIIGSSDVKMVVLEFEETE